MIFLFHLIIDAQVAGRFLVVVQYALELVKDNRNVSQLFDCVPIPEHHNVLELGCVHFGILGIKLTSKTAPRLQAIVALDDAHNLRGLAVTLGQRPQVIIQCAPVGRLELGQARDVEGLFLFARAVERTSNVLIVHGHPGNEPL